MLARVRIAISLEWLPLSDSSSRCEQLPRRDGGSSAPRTIAPRAGARSAEAFAEPFHHRTVLGCDRSLSSRLSVPVGAALLTGTGRALEKDAERVSAETAGASFRSPIAERQSPMAG